MRLIVALLALFLSMAITQAWAGQAPPSSPGTPASNPSDPDQGLLDLAAHQLNLELVGEGKWHLIPSNVPIVSGDTGSSDDAVTKCKKHADGSYSEKKIIVNVKTFKKVYNFLSGWAFFIILKNALYHEYLHCVGNDGTGTGTGDPECWDPTLPGYACAHAKIYKADGKRACDRILFEFEFGCTDKVKELCKAYEYDRHIADGFIKKCPGVAAIPDCGPCLTCHF